MTRPHRWDVSDPSFLSTVLRAVIAVGVVTVGGSILMARHAVWSVLAGVVLANLLYLAAFYAGRIFVRTGRFAPVLLWLLASQAVLWIGMAVVLSRPWINPAGFAVGVATLPAAIVLTVLFWWLVLNKGRMS